MSNEENKCPACGEAALRKKSVQNYEYRTPMGIVTIERESRFDECGACGEVFIPGQLIDEWNHIILKQLHDRATVLTPEELQFVFSVLPYSQNELAKATGKDRSTLTKYKSGENPIDVLFDDALKQIIADWLEGKSETLDRLRSKSQFVPQGQVAKKLLVH